MTSAKKQGPIALSEQLVNPPQDAGTFENIPRVKRVTGSRGHTDIKFANKVAIITGANSPQGIGRAAAHRFAAHGIRAIFLCDFADSHLEVHKRELKDLYPSTSIEVRKFDAADESSVKAICEEALRLYGRLDIFFANAGITGPNTRFQDIDSKAFLDVMKVNALGVFLAIKYGSKAMLVTSEKTCKSYPSGSIIATSSVAGQRSNAGSTPYSASKSAVISLVQTCAYQLTGTGIRLNAICPGIIETGMTKVMYDAARSRGTESKIGQLNPLRRGGLPDEVAGAVEWLADTDGSGYVNGEAIRIDGGLGAGLPYVVGKLA